MPVCFITFWLAFYRFSMFSAGKKREEKRRRRSGAASAPRPSSRGLFSPPLLLGGCGLKSHLGSNIWGFWTYRKISAIMENQTGAFDYTVNIHKEVLFIPELFQYIFSSIHFAILTFYISNKDNSYYEKKSTVFVTHWKISLEPFLTLLYSNI